MGARAEESESYDVIVVGSGVAGLHTAIELLREFPRLRLAVFEQYGATGGRATTFKKEIDGVKLQWEAGAGRISEAHTLVLKLLKRYKIKWIPIGGALQFAPRPGAALEPNVFEAAIPVLLDTIAGLPAEDLARHTVRQLLTRIHGGRATDNYLLRFPYRAEVDIMRADMALQLFAHEMRAHKGYGICEGGLSRLTNAMTEEVERRGGDVHTYHELTGLADGVATFRQGSPKEGTGRPERTVRAGKIVLALPSAVLARMPTFKGWGTLRHLRMTPLVRIYGAFKAGDDGKLWYEEYGGRIVTPGPVRYVIPGSADIGSCQISYTDSQDAEHWIRRIDAVGEKGAGKEVVEQLRELLKPTIPSPWFVKAHVWEEGVTYWLPGDYSPVEESRAAVRPLPTRLPSVWACGESYSLRQGWMEGALEHAEVMLRGLKREIRKARAEIQKAR